MFHQFHERTFELSLSPGILLVYGYINADISVLLIALLQSYPYQNMVGKVSAEKGVHMEVHDSYGLECKKSILCGRVLHFVCEGA